jgi:FlaG/FlaF family flagellin (archaellin)
MRSLLLLIALALALAGAVAAVIFDQSPDVSVPPCVVEGFDGCAPD